jgi:uncharacterized repeat protein (TIGR01451 family)
LSFMTRSDSVAQWPPWRRVAYRLISALPKVLSDSPAEPLRPKSREKTKTSLQHGKTVEATNPGKYQGFACVDGLEFSGDLAKSDLFEALTRQLLADGVDVRFQARGASMSPGIRDGQIVHVRSVPIVSLKKGDILLVRDEFGFRLHRLVQTIAGADIFVTRGDCGREDDPVVRRDQILGVAVAKEVRIGRRIMQVSTRGVKGRILRCGERGRSVLARGRTMMNLFRPRRAIAHLAFLAAFCLFAATVVSHAAVAVDSTTNTNARLTGVGVRTLNFTHTTAVTANRLLIVGVSMNIQNATATNVTGITYNGTALTRLGVHNDAAPTRRVELWYLLNPLSGNRAIVVSVFVPLAVQVGVVAGATTFTGVDQTAPLGTFVSANGAAGTNSQLDVPSMTNGMILDTLATGGDQAITVPGPQVAQWSARTGTTIPPDVRGSGTTRTGAPNVPISETFSGTSNWSLGAVSVNPTAGDLGVITTVATVLLGQNSVYKITVSNDGPSDVSTVTLTDTLVAGQTFVSATSPTMTCTGTGPITCTQATLATGTSTTVTVTVTAGASGSYANTATVTDSGTPPDLNTGNNSFIAVATVQSIGCATVSQATAGGTLTGVINTYYPGTASVAMGVKSIPVGAATGSGTAIVAGNLLLVIQMQDASINSSNTVAYGNGGTGTGFTALNSTGNFEFVTATGPVAAGSVPIAGTGVGGGLVFSYNFAAASGTKGQSRYQVVLVPQYTTATLSAGLIASPWNGSTGGVLAIDTSSTLTLGGVTVSVNGLGFRGGAGLQLNGGVAGADTDYVLTAPTAYAGTVVNGLDAPKGEGIAGTPRWLESGGTFLNTGVEGYPNGSMARGAPGNAGGGGTDGDAAVNQENAGGGGGGNGGAGGSGGDSWSSNLSNGGAGGSLFPASMSRIALGGGGGGGTRNNSDGDNQASGGAAGGGIIIIRANALTGTATLTANGLGAYNGTLNDAGGGGGAGGSIVVLSANGGEGGLTLQANGGRGGDAWDAQPYSLGDRHGPGGGGGGGAIFVSGVPTSLTVAGGTSGTTLNPGVAYGATAGDDGTQVTNATLSQTSGTQSGAQCTPDMTLGKSHVGNFVRGSTASYTVPVSNLSLFGATTGTVTINDTLPIGLTPVSATGTGWACSVASQTVSCVRSDALSASSSYPSITVNANVTQTAPATLTNTAFVSGGGELNLANDSATDVAGVVSSADLSVTESGSPNPVAAGSNITYTAVVTNSGPSAADNATLVATIPANTTFVSIASPAGWTCSAGTSNVVCTISSMAGSTAATFSMVVKVNAGTANGTVIGETATVNSSASDSNSTNNTATVNTIVGVTAGADLSVSNSASPNPVLAGSNITYTQVVTNTGSAAATTATFSEPTPANTTFVSITAPAGWTCTSPPVSCTNPSVAAGSSGTFTAVYTVIAGTASGTVITDTATTNAANDTTAGDNSATATDVVATAGQADLALATTATPPTVFSGNNITYTQTVTNNGPAAASTVSFAEATPTNTTFQSVSAPAGWTCTTPPVGGTGTITCTNPTFAASASVDIIVVVNVAPTVAAGTITATSNVSAATADPTLANNSTTVNTIVKTVCDLTAGNSGSPNPVIAGNNITYTQTVTNSGPSNCATATFGEPTPANTTFVSVAVVTTGGGTWTCPNVAPIACTNPSAPPGSTGTITAIYKVVAGTTAGTIITDTATAATATRDTNPTDNAATVSIAVAGATQADLRVTNSGSPNPVTAGNNITYSQTLTNGGPVAASTISFTETLPANTTRVSLTGPAGWTCTLATLTCTNATLAASGTANFTFVVQVNTNVASGTTITQTDSVTSATGDPNLANNSASTSVQVADSADLSVTNTASPVPVLANANITYTQVVTNAGPSAATTATFTEVTPPNTTFQSITPAAGWSCTTPSVGGTGTISCTNPSVVPGSGSFTVVLKVNAGTASGTAINDTVTVSSAVTDPNSGNNAATAADVVATATQADLITSNSASPGSVAPGGNVTYTQSVTNAGPAAATAATFTQSTPPNTTFQSIAPQAGWTCVTPAVGGTGTITCTDGSNLAVNGTANFTLVLQVAASTTSGTSIAEAVTASASNVIPGLTSNTATATVVVASATSADVAIIKTATPNPVLQGDNLTYTLTVTNNGPASATNVTAADTLPSAVTYLSVNTNVGTCSESGGTVTCLLGTMANASTATITILTLAGAPGVVSNTATVTADQSDSNLGNNSSTQTETITASTSIQLHGFTAQAGTNNDGTNRVVLTWKTGEETHNLGFNVYREEDGNRVRLNPSLIAGSALLMRGALPRHSGKTYAWIDGLSRISGGGYWLEDVDINGTRTMHGPILPSASSPDTAATSLSSTRMFSQLNQAQPLEGHGEGGQPVEKARAEFIPTSTQIEKQFELASHPAVKLMVRREGWHRVTQPELVKAGLDPNVDPTTLRLFAEAVEQPLQVIGATAGSGGFGPQAAIAFYGTGIDTLYSGNRVYWLVANEGRGARIRRLPPSSGSNQPPSSFPYVVELRQHTTYFAALPTQNGDNFFGAFVSPTPVDQVLALTHLETPSTNPAQLEVVLQGVIAGVPHEVTVALNGTTLGEATFTGQDQGKFQVNIPDGLLTEGNNTVTLTAQNGDYDTSLVVYVRVVYPHSYVADSDELRFTGRAGDELKVSGLGTAPAVVLDITSPDVPVQLTPRVISKEGTYEFAVQVPWLTTNTAAPVQHTLLAVATDRVASVAAVRPNHPSRWHSAQPGADIAMVSLEDFAGVLQPLVQAHRAEGKSSAVVLINDLYDEFNFGEHSPYAIRRFLQFASKNWKTAPKFLLLNGRASVDPRNYLGFGHQDFVPTKIVSSSSLMTASDDWFSDFNDSGFPTIATGRIPVSSVEEATTVIGKIVTYEGQSTNGSWTGQALMVADRNDTENFSQDSLLVQAQLPANLQVTDVFATTLDVVTARQQIISGINSGKLLVNYIGHGSEEDWSAEDLFDNTAATALTNGSQLPVFLIMNCLNGFFQDVYEQPLGVTLMMVPNGGSVAVLASSGLNQAPPQTQLDVIIAKGALSASRPALGEVIRQAKFQITDASVRKTYVLFGDPAMRIKAPSSAALNQ